MTIELRKKEDVTGDTSFSLYIDNSCEKSFVGADRENEATEFFVCCVTRAKEGYPKESTILKETI